MTKKLVTITLFIFWAFVTSIAVAALIRYDKNSTVTNEPSNSVNYSFNSSNATNNVKTNATSVQGSKLTLAVVAKHNSSSDCWVIIKGNVYNLTAFLRKHSGGSEAITPYCGIDGTNAFLTRNSNPPDPHSNRNLSSLNVYKVGALD